ncbi:MAG: alpha-E domain-containing protein [Polaromonas sp.]|nr:alpha-E domain-containing protein [Polaromonas sp.]
MLSRTADHLFWMSRYTERAGDMPKAFAGMTHQLREALVRSSPKYAKRVSACGVCGH